MASMVALGFCLDLPAQVVLVDFNRTDPPPTGNWNSIALADQNLTLVDSSGSATSIQLSHTFPSGSGISSIPYVGGNAAWFDAAAVTDGWQIGSAARQVNFSGFGSGVTVSFSVIAARGSGASGATQTMSLVGASTITIANAIAPYGTGMSTDGSSVTLFTGQVQPSGGVIQLLISGSPRATINALRLEVTPVPEPAEYGLAAAVAAVAFALRRHVAKKE
jgi:hypothetical protein